MRKIYVHLVSDSTGDTLSVIAKTIFAQFEHIEVRQYLWAFVNTKEHLSKATATIKKKPGIIMHTISNEEHVKTLDKVGQEINVPCIEVLKRVIDIIANYLEEKPNPEPGKHHTIDKEYFCRIEAINFTIAHDDGQHSDNLNKADIILVGPSRTSKSPTSMYLAYRGMKTANIPYVSGIGFPFDVTKIKNTFIVGLLVCTKRLVEIRKNRLLSINGYYRDSYVDEEKVQEEMLEAKRICVKNNWPTVDITHKSIEETAAIIIQMYHKWRKTKK